MNPRSWFRVLAAGLALSAAGAIAADPPFPKFEERTLDPHAGDVVYAVTHADVDGDGRQDVVAVTEDQVLWYAAPEWTKHVLLDGETTRDNVCIAPHDIDGDEKVDFALGAGWPQNGGTIQWLSRRGAPDEPWEVHFIAEIPSTHRMRWADVLGTGRPQLTVSPLNATDGAGVKLTAFEIPADPKTDRWPATVMDESLNRMHNHWHEHLNRDGVHETFTASQEGVHLIRRIPGGYEKEKLSDGATGEKPTEKGAGEVKFGRLGGKALLATVEPMHGNMAVVYVGDQGLASKTWTRHVMDDTLGRGHAVWLEDLDGDKGDEIVVGHSDPATGAIKGPGVYVYKAADESGTEWTKHVIDDGGMATEDLFVLDLTGDGRPDILAGGRNTHNVKLYVNRGE
ncbi:MAG TPA: VCBS repeat-containing protein [Planctomycetaceae bacterium]